MFETHCKIRRKTLVYSYFFYLSIPHAQDDCVNVIHLGTNIVSLITEVNVPEVKVLT